jgi:hypothetical protein
MSSFSEPWLYYVIATIAGLMLFNIAITGTLVSRSRPIVTVQSVPLRIAFFLISVAIFALLIWMTKHQIAAGLQYFNQPS